MVVAVLGCPGKGFGPCHLKSSCTSIRSCWWRSTGKRTNIFSLKLLYCCACGFSSSIDNDGVNCIQKSSWTAGHPKYNETYVFYNNRRVIFKVIESRGQGYDLQFKLMCFPLYNFGLILSLLEFIFPLESCHSSEWANEARNCLGSSMFINLRSFSVNPDSQVCRLKSL